MGNVSFKRTSRLRLGLESAQVPWDDSPCFYTCFAISFISDAENRHIARVSGAAAARSHRSALPSAAAGVINAGRQSRAKPPDAGPRP